VSWRARQGCTRKWIRELLKASTQLQKAMERKGGVVFCSFIGRGLSDDMGRQPVEHHRVHESGRPEPYRYIRCIHSIFGREITIHTVIYGVYIRFWPTLGISFADEAAPQVPHKLQKINRRTSCSSNGTQAAPQLPHKLQKFNRRTSCSLNGTQAAPQLTRKLQ